MRPRPKSRSPIGPHTRDFVPPATGELRLASVPANDACGTAPGPWLDPQIDVDAWLDAREVESG